MNEQWRENIRKTWRKKLMAANWDTLGWDGMRRRIIIEQDGKCNHCDIDEWRGSPLSLEVDHINGINDDNRRENLEAICPNCHSITDSWRG